MKKTLSIVFLLSREHKGGHKEIDHALPFIYLLQKHLPDGLELLKTRLIFGTYRSHLVDRADSRIDFFKTLENVDIVELPCPPIIGVMVRVARQANKFLPTRPLFSLIKRFLRRYDKKHARQAVTQVSLGDNFLNADYPLFIATNLSGSTKTVADEVRSMDPRVQFLIIPHGTIMCENEMVHDDDMGQDRNDWSNPLLNAPDKILFTSGREKKECTAGGMRESIGRPVGSPRYCSEWLSAKQSNELDGPLPSTKSQKRNILFLIPKRFINIWHEELERTIYFLASYPSFDIILQGETPNYPALSQLDNQHGNVRRLVIGQDYSSSALIDWADVVIHAGAGVVYESYMRGKLTVLPSYITANVFISERYDAGVYLHCRDDLRDFCNRLSASLVDARNFFYEPNRAAIERYIEDFVEKDDQSVGKNIARAIQDVTVGTDSK